MKIEKISAKTTGCHSHKKWEGERENRLNAFGEAKYNLQEKSFFPFLSAEIFHLWLKKETRLQNILLSVLNYVCGQADKKYSLLLETYSRFQFRCFSVRTY